MDAESKYMSEFFVAFMIQKLETLKVDHLFLVVSNNMARDCMLVNLGHTFLLIWKSGENHNILQLTYQHLYLDLDLREKLGSCNTGRNWGTLTEFHRTLEV